jgi:hypothetical protein
MCRLIFPVRISTASVGFTYSLDLLRIIPDIQLLSSKTRVSLPPKMRTSVERVRISHPVITKTMLLEDGLPKVLPNLVASLFQEL